MEVRNVGDGGLLDSLMPVTHLFDPVYVTEVATRGTPRVGS